MKITCSWQGGCNELRYNASAYCREHNNEMKRRRKAKPKTYVFKRHDYELDEWLEVDRESFKREKDAFEHASILEDKHVCMIDIFLEIK